MLKHYFNISILLSVAWYVYGYCQKDILLPTIALGIIVSSLLIRLKSGTKQFSSFKNIPYFITIIISLISGLLWKSLFPPPLEVSSPFPQLISAFQAGSIFASLIIFLKPFNKNNVYQLTFLAWLTVTTSINVHFNEQMMLGFCSYCVISLAFVIVQTMKQPDNKKHIFKHYRDFIFYSIILITVTTGFFFGISKSIVVIDKIFTYIIRDYVMPNHYTNFLNMNSKLTLGPPGRSAWDKRPVLEINIPDVKGVYLKTQVFDSYTNGTWQENFNIIKYPIANTLDKNQITSEMIMFTSFNKIIPTPPNVKTAKSFSVLSKSTDHIIYGERAQRTRKLRYSLTKTPPHESLNESQIKKYTELPPKLRPILKELSSEIINGEKNISKKAILLQNYFLDNYQYNLNVQFKADDDGIIKMIKEKQAAYCSYFASALALLLRSEGIPARVAAGFATGEVVNIRNNTFLARVYHAHAWTEVLLPTWNEKEQRWIKSWQISDATPPTKRLDAIKNEGLNINYLVEKIWLSMLRLSAYKENINKDSLKKCALILFVLIVLLKNKGYIFKIFRLFLKAQHKKSSLNITTPTLLLTIYHRYQLYLKSTCNELRKESDTDQDVLNRLKQRLDIPKETVAKIESFLKNYHDVRFGEKKDLNLEPIIQAIETRKK